MKWLIAARRSAIVDGDRPPLAEVTGGLESRSSLLYCIAFLPLTGRSLNTIIYLKAKLYSIPHHVM